MIKASRIMQILRSNKFAYTIGIKLTVFKFFLVQLTKVFNLKQAILRLKFDNHAFDWP